MLDPANVESGIGERSEERVSEALCRWSQVLYFLHIAKRGVRR